MSWKKSSAGDPGAREPKTGGAPGERTGAAPLPDTPGPGVPIAPEPLHSLRIERPKRLRARAEAQYRPGMGPGLAAEQEGDRRADAPEMPSDEELDRAAKRAASSKG